MVSSVAVAFAQARYTITDLGVFDGYYSSHATAINDRGEVVGFCVRPDGDASPSRGFVYRNGHMVDLKALREQDAVRAYSINNRGHIVGTSGTHVFLYRDGKLTDLRSQTGYVTAVRGINDRGEIVGTAFENSTDPNSELEERAFALRNGRLIYLTGMNIRASEAWAINQHGSVVGSFGMDAFLYRNGRLRTISPPHGFDRYNALSVNDLGDIVGIASVESRIGATAFLYRRGRFLRLNRAGQQDTVPWCINNRGQIVGYFEPHNEALPTHAFLYERGKLIDLNALVPEQSGWHLIKATAINNRGQIAGDGTYHGKRRAFLLTPR